ncbi:MAG TPA: GDSL-type esterase/lipase family protein, partial [Lacipirellulaceae bacterium]|nr:GDSL-type esterase/lipase family protein [Lacipirellulaceae bacterium]
PEATIVLTAIFPRDDKPDLMPTINDMNSLIAKFADGDRIRFLNVNSHLAGEDGKLLEGMLQDGLHPTEKGYQVWADSLKPILTDILGPPAKTDHAPPPTGNPADATPTN